jgi:hypothetical protein
MPGDRGELSALTEMPGNPAVISASDFAKALVNECQDFGSEDALLRTRKGRCDMFRVSYSDTADGQRWSLYGRLAGPWVDEMRSCWKYARDRAPLAHAIVDLKDVTFIDQAGEKLLAEMRNAGAELIATGVEHQHLLATLDDPKSPPLRGTVPEGRNK